MQYAIFSDLDVLQSHICSSLVWNGKSENQILFADDETSPVALLCNHNDDLKTTAVWLKGMKLADSINNLENALYITALSNIKDCMVEFAKQHNDLAIVEIDGEVDLKHMIESNQFELVDTILEDF